MGIQDPDALQCFSGITHCPWCGKESQNEGTMVNHLQTVHYRLGLVCNRCHDCPSTMADTLLAWPAGLSPIWGKKSQHVSLIEITNRGSKTVTSRDPNKEVRMEWSTPGCPIGNTPTCCYSPGEGPADKVPPANPHIPSPIPLQDSTGQLPATFEDEVQSCQ